MLRKLSSTHARWWRSLVIAVLISAWSVLPGGNQATAQDGSAGNTNSADQTASPDPTVLAMLSFTFPVERGNEAIESGEWDMVLDQVFEILNPQAAYFHLRDGQRAAFFIYEVVEAEELVQVNELLFRTLDASVEQEIVMDAMQLREGLGGN
ncbi:MAG: hypothetical protein AAF414_11345 [Pseudomonadota bacterium]